MKLYRIKDTSEKDVNLLINGDLECVDIEVQGFNGTINLNRDTQIKSVVINDNEFVFEKPTFLVRGKQVFNDIDTFDLVNVKKDDLKQSKANNTFIPCKYNNMKARYNAQTKVCEVIFEGICYIA